MTFRRVHSNSKVVSYLPCQIKYPYLKTTNVLSMLGQCIPPEVAGMYSLLTMSLIDLN